MTKPDDEQTREDGPAVGTAEAPPKRKTKPAPPKQDQLPPFNVVLHNDDVNSMEHVIKAIVAITPLTLEVAVRKMLEAAHAQALAAADHAQGAGGAVPRSVQEQEADGDDRAGGGVRFGFTANDPALRPSGSGLGLGREDGSVFEERADIVPELFFVAGAGEVVVAGVGVGDEG